jgi:hypothetical protein
MGTSKSVIAGNTKWGLKRLGTKSSCLVKIANCTVWLLDESL